MLRGLLGVEGNSKVHHKGGQVKAKGEMPGYGKSVRECQESSHSEKQVVGVLDTSKFMAQIVRFANWNNQWVSLGHVNNYPRDPATERGRDGYKATQSSHLATKLGAEEANE
eukprot:EG_transcript_53529